MENTEKSFFEKYKHLFVNALERLPKPLERVIVFTYVSTHEPDHGWYDEEDNCFRVYTAGGDSTIEIKLESPYTEQADPNQEYGVCWLDFEMLTTKQIARNIAEQCRIDSLHGSEVYEIHEYIEKSLQS